MGMRPSPNAALGSITAHRILAEPIMSSFDSGSPVKSIRLTATCPDAPAKRWLISFEQLGASLTKILGKATTAEQLECLRIGQVIKLPGTYNPYELAPIGIS